MEANMLRCPSVGPISKTMVDFWRLVWQVRPPTIVMVTNLKEGSKVKCEQYWPDQGTQEYGPFKVTLTDQQVFADYTIRQLLVSVSLEAAGSRVCVCVLIVIASTT